MSEIKDDEDVYIGEQPMSKEAAAMSEIIKKMSIVERAVAVLDMLAHDEEVMAIVRSRMNWELRNAVIEGTRKLQREVTERDVLGAFGYALSMECDDYMRVAFPEQYEEYNLKFKSE